MLEPEDEPEEVEVATGTTTVDEPKIWVETAWVAVCWEPDEIAEAAGAPELGLELSTTKGFDEDPPAAFFRSNLVEPIASCRWRSADRSFELTALPLFMAHIQALLLSVGSMKPPLH
jgi:hypothetical protein